MSSSTRPERKAAKGGTVVFEGTFAALKKSGTKAGKHLMHRAALKTEYRAAKGHLLVVKATLNNLRHLTANIPKGVLTVVSGVAGSGKSSLMHGCLVPPYPECGRRRSDAHAALTTVLDVGPGAGDEGGKIAFEGVPAKLVQHAASLTGQRLAKRVA